MSGTTDHHHLSDLLSDAKSLAFGARVHFCLGAQSAKLEIEIALSSLFQRIPMIGLKTHIQSKEPTLFFGELISRYVLVTVKIHNRSDFYLGWYEAIRVREGVLPWSI